MPEDDPQTSLSPPSPPSQAMEDPGAHELESSDSDDHFSDARSDRAAYSRTASPIPTTRVERVDHEASYGEVPGTTAYQQRAEDARPDEVAFVEENPAADNASPVSRPVTPIPETVLEEAPRSPILGHAHKPSTPKIHPTDSLPDRVIYIPDPAVDGAAAEEGGDVSGTRPRSPTSLPAHKPETRSRTSSSARPPASINYHLAQHADVGAGEDEDEDEDAGFGDDFDDFEEGGEDAEFGDFDDGFQEAEGQPVQSLPQIASLPFPPLSFDTLDSPAEVLDATTPYIEALFPSPLTPPPPVPPTTTTKTTPFPTPRSASLWAQLSAPPPLQPPHWLRSRIRRLFLVSLGVPIDLDEILPASKQSKLILPSTISPRLSSSSSPRLGSTSRLRPDDENRNASSASLDSQGKPPSSSSKRRRGPPPPPPLDLPAARRTCSITDAAIAGLTDQELKDHVKQLETLQGAAASVLEYWTRRTDEKIGDREAFEGVIENLVQHARKVRK